MLLGFQNTQVRNLDIILQSDRKFKEHRSIQDKKYNTQQKYFQRYIGDHLQISKQKQSSLRCKAFRIPPMGQILGIGAPEALLIAVVALVLLGPQGLAAAAKQLGQSLKAIAPSIREALDLSQEVKQTVEQEMGLDEIRKEFQSYKSQIQQGFSPYSIQDAPKQDQVFTQSNNNGGSLTQQAEVMREDQKSQTGDNKNNSNTSNNNNFDNSSNGSTDNSSKQQDIQSLSNLQDDPDIIQKRQQSLQQAWGDLPPIEKAKDEVKDKDNLKENTLQDLKAKYNISAEDLEAIKGWKSESKQ